MELSARSRGFGKALWAFRVRGEQVTGPRLAVGVALVVCLASATGCGGGSTHSGLGDGTSTPTSSTAAPRPTVASIVACLRGRGASTHVGGGPTPGARAIHGTLGGVGYQIIVTESDGDARNVLEAFLGLSGASRTVNGVPIQDMMKRSGRMVVFYPGRVRPDVSREIEACFGDHAQLDPELLAGLRPAGCAGASGTAMAELTKPESVTAWKPDHVEGGGCVVNFTTTLIEQELVKAVRAELTAHGWETISPIGEGYGLLYMGRSPLVAVLSNEGGRRYSLYITAAGNLG